MSEEGEKKASGETLDAGGTGAGALAPVPAQTIPGGPQLPLPMPGNALFGVSITNAQVEALKRVTPEHITADIAHRHQQALRRLDLEEKAIADDEAERIRAHERDQRDRHDNAASDGRLERMFYVVLVFVALVSIALAWKGGVDTALKFVAGFVAVLVTLAGGVGVEKIRRERSDRALKREPSPKRLPASARDDDS